MIRSLGGWSEVLSMRKRGERKLTDQRILGSGDFVKSILDEADESVKNQFAVQANSIKIKEIIQCICEDEEVNVEELKSGGRRKAVSRVRFLIASKLVEEYGISFSEVARYVGVTTPAIFYILRRKGNKLM